MHPAERMHTTESAARRSPSALHRLFLLRLVVVAALVCVLLAAGVALYRHERALRLAAVERALAMQRMVIEHTLRAAEADLTMLVADAELRGLLAGDQTDYRQAVSGRLLALLDAKLKYRGVRVFNRRGDELIRIDSGGPPGSLGGSSDVFATRPDGSWQAGSMPGELLVSPVSRQTERASERASSLDILPISAILSDGRGGYLGRVTLDVSLDRMLHGMSLAGGELGQSLLLDGEGHVLLGAPPPTGAPDGGAIASAVMDGDDGTVRTADGEYAVSTLVYRSPRPLRGDEGFLEPPGTPPGSGTGVLKTVIFRPGDSIRDAVPFLGSGLVGTCFLGIGGLLLFRAKGSRSGETNELAVVPAAAVSQPFVSHGGEGAVRRGDALLERILNAVPQPIFVKDRQGRFLFLNDALCEMAGYRREEMLGRRDHDFFPKEQADHFVARDQEVFGSDQRTAYEETLTDARGEVHVLLTRKAACMDTAGGDDVLVGVVTDITERKRSEEMLRLSAEVFEQSAEGILITDDQGIILNVNHAFTRISGYSAQEAIGSHARMLTSGALDLDFFSNIFRAIESNGFWIGEMVCRRKSGELYVVEIPVCAVRDDQGCIRRYIGMMSDITHRKRNEERMRYLAQHDFLTGLANRLLLQDRVSQAILHARRSHRKVGVLLLDLDGFKDVNDRFGHEAGDQVLKDVGARLTRLVRQTDTVARIGGDEFIAVLPGIRSSSDAARIARKVVNDVSRPFTVAGGVARVGVSIGVALYPDDGEDWTALSRVADRAMYREKHARSRRSSVRLRP